MNIYQKSKWINSEQQDELLREFFSDSPIQIDWNFRFYQKVENNTLIFGAWAGPEQCITNLIHEMAHLVEIDDARILKNGWGLITPKVYIPGRYSRMCYEPITHQGSLRECRVIALQWHLQNYLGIQKTPGEAVSALVHLPDFCNVPSDEKISCYKEREAARLVYLENKMFEYSRDKYTLEFFRTEWERKNQLLRNALNG